jgi:hypothetical protein
VSSKVPTGNCCHGSSGPSHKKSRLGWWLLGGFVAVGAVSWAFQGNLLVDRLAPLSLGILALIWLVIWTIRRIGDGG